jgi:hypothetical protein
MVLGLVTLKAVLELSPFNSSSVPPDKTGLGPTKARGTVIPLEIFETRQTLHAVMSRFQIPVEGPVCVKTKV